jgi:hypothetical protein
VLPHVEPRARRSRQHPRLRRLLGARAALAQRAVARAAPGPVAGSAQATTARRSPIACRPTSRSATSPPTRARSSPARRHARGRPVPLVTVAVRPLAQVSTRRCCRTSRPA